MHLRLLLFLLLGLSLFLTLFLCAKDLWSGTRRCMCTVWLRAAHGMSGRSNPVTRAKAASHPMYRRSHTCKRMRMHGSNGTYALCQHVPRSACAAAIASMSRNKEGKRKQRGVPQPVASKKRQKRSSDYYEDDASDPDEEKHSNRYDVRKLLACLRWSRLHPLSTASLAES
jgi:hypothetical protein